MTDKVAPLYFVIRTTMLPADFNTRVIIPAVQLFPFQDSPLAQRILLAIAGQESGWAEREQIDGPARGFWQFERPGGVRGVMAHIMCKTHLEAFCAKLEIPFDEYTLFEAIAWCDPLAYAMARLLLWSDPRPLPTDEDVAWALYLRLWRPGRPRPLTWASYYNAAGLTIV
jgi:hypothetical protein